MTDPTPHTSVPGVEGPRSALAAGSYGCMFGGGVAGAAGVIWFFIAMQTGSPRTAALLMAGALIVFGIVMFRRYHREHMPVAVGVIIGIAIGALLAGMCAGQFQ